MSKKVFVSGCYDMLHSGHVAFFQEAASHGDLYVGLGSDQTIYELKGRRTINRNEERLYMVKSIRYVKDAWINSGHGIMDFEQDVLALKPDIFFVNSDGYTPEKESFCKAHGIELIISRRVPSSGLPARSTTLIRQECRIPYRIELCGGWLDQPFVSKVHGGAVLTCSIYPDYEFNERSGMATSSRKKAIELWQTELPVGDPEQLAHTLFCVENPPGTKEVSGSQDQLGMLLPGVNKLNYDGDFWPVSIERLTDDETADFIERHLRLVQLPLRHDGYDPYGNVNITEAKVAALAKASEDAWQAIRLRDAKAWGVATTACLEAQVAMFPNMMNPAVKSAIERYRSVAHGWKMTGAGGGGYMLLITDAEIEEGIQIHVRR